ncbi:MAG: hypothetical protein L0Z62_28610 [Gemmataceae bacterium]|nr:hypothetical protein [Gemmataceae bacterium]
MPFTFQCDNPQCGKTLSAREDLIGKRVRCPGCGQVAVVPAPVVQPPPEQFRAPPPFQAPDRSPRGGDWQDEGVRPPPQRAAGGQWQEYEDEGPRGRPARPRYQPSTFRKLFLFATLCFAILPLPLLLAGALYFIGESKDPGPRRFDPRLGRVVLDLRGGDQRVPYYTAATFCLLAGIPLVLASGVLFLILLYKSWNLIQDGRAQTSAGKAVGFLFIPFFNLYWIFVAYRGLAEDMARYMARHRISGPRPSAGLGLAYAILTLTAGIPFVGIATALAATVVLILFMNGVKNAAVAIIEAERGGQPHLA